MSYFDSARDWVATFIDRLLFSVPLPARSTPAWQALLRIPRSIRVHDELTGLLNRREFKRRASNRIRRRGQWAVLLFNVDRLADANISLGPQAVDAVLIALANTIQRLADGRVTARYGGDQFVVLVESRHLADELAKRIRSAVASEFCVERTRTLAASPELAGTPLLTLSVGAADSAGGEQFPKLVQRAKGALKEAKRGGRDCIRWAAPS